MSPGPPLYTLPTDPTGQTNINNGHCFAYLPLVLDNPSLVLSLTHSYTRVHLPINIATPPLLQPRPAARSSRPGKHIHPHPSSRNNKQHHSRHALSSASRFSNDDDDWHLAEPLVQEQRAAAESSSCCGFTRAPLEDARRGTWARGQRRGPRGH